MHKRNRRGICASSSNYGADIFPADVHWSFWYTCPKGCYICADSRLNKLDSIYAPTVSNSICRMASNVGLFRRSIIGLNSHIDGALICIEFTLSKDSSLIRARTFGSREAAVEPTWTKWQDCHFAQPKVAQRPKGRDALSDRIYGVP